MIDLDSTSSAPPYEQIRSQIAAQSRTAEQPGDRLPTYAAWPRTGLATNTVARDRELEQAVIETRVGPAASSPATR